MRRSSATTLLVSAALFGSTAVEAQQAWDYEIISFLWASDLDGRENVGGTPVDIEADFSDLIEFVDIGLALRFIAHRDRVRWYLEGSYVELEDDLPIPTGSLNVESKQTYAEAGLSYELTLKLAVYGGVRYQKLTTDLNFPLTRFSSEEDWADGFVGLRWSPVLSDNWVTWLRGDAGAGGSDLTWLAEAGAGFRFGTAWTTYLSYRMLDTDYSHDDFSYDMQQHGLILGFGYRF
jgi:hypothetical protein